MKKSYILLLLAFFSQLLMAQPSPKEVDISWGKKIRTSKRTTLTDVVGYDQTGIYALKRVSRGLGGFISEMALEHYDNNMNQTGSVKMELKNGRQKLELEFIIQYNEKLYAFASYKDQKQKQNILSVQPIDKKSLLPQRKPTELASISYEGERKANSGSFGYSLSRDSTKMLIFYKLPYQRKENERFGFHVFDKELKELWRKEVSLPYEEKLFEVERYKVDNSGNVHLLGRIFKEKRKEKRKGEVNYKYQVLSYRDQGGSLTEYPVQIDGMFLTDMQIDISLEQDIICAGFYSEEGKRSIKGSYFVKIDGGTKKLKKQSVKEFSPDFITQHMSDRKAKRTKRKIEKGKNVEMFEFDLDELLIREDGGVLLIGEQYYVDEVNFTSMGPGSVMSHHSTTFYNYNDIIVININPEGAIDWAQKIPKYQSTKEDGGFFSSYVMAVVKDKLLFLFNDNPKNLYAKPGKKYNFNPRKRQSTVMLVSLDGEGNQQKVPLFMTADADVIIRPKVCEQVSGQELVIFGQRKRKQRFMKIRFKETDLYGTVNGN